MKIILNNKEENFESEIISISEIMKLKNFTFKMLVISINGNIIKKDDYDKSYVVDGDKVIILHLISGG